MVISNAYGSDLSLVMRVGSSDDRPARMANDLDASHPREMDPQSSLLQGDALMGLLYEQY